MIVNGKSALDREWFLYLYHHFPVKGINLAVLLSMMKNEDDQIFPWFVLPFLHPK